MSQPGSISLILKVALTQLLMAGLWSVLSEILFRKLSTPVEIEKLEDKKKRRLRFGKYVSNYMATIQASSAVLVGGYLLITNGIKYGEINEHPLINWVLMASFF